MLLAVWLRSLVTLTGDPSTDDAHRKDHVRVLPTLEEIAQDIVGDPPDKRDDLLCVAWSTIDPSSRSSHFNRRSFDGSSMRPTVFETVGTTNLNST